MALEHFEKHSYQKGKVDWNFNILFDDQPQIVQIAKEYAKLLTHPVLYPSIPTQWLHATVLLVGTTDEYSEAEMLQVAEKLTPELAKLSLHEFLLGPWWIWSGNPVLHITPEGPLVELFNLTLSTVKEVVGEKRTPKPSRFIPHITLAYSPTYDGEKEVHSQLSTKHIKPVKFRVSKLSLVKQRQASSYYDWKVIKELKTETTR